LRVQALLERLAGEADASTVAAYSQEVASEDTRKHAEAFSCASAGTIYLVMATDDGHAQHGKVYTGQAVRSRSPFGAVLDRMNAHMHGPSLTRFEDGLVLSPHSFEAVLVYVYEGSVPGKAATLTVLDFLEDAHNGAMVAAGRSLNTATVCLRTVREWNGRSDRSAKLLSAPARHLDQYGDLCVAVSACDPLFGTGEAFGKAVHKVRNGGYLVAGMPERRTVLIGMGFDFTNGAEDKWRRTRIQTSRGLVKDLLASYAKHCRQPMSSDGPAGNKLYMRRNSWLHAGGSRAPPSCLTERLDTALRAEQARRRRYWRTASA